MPAAPRSRWRSASSGQIFPKPGWVEHDPKEIWQSQLATAREAIAKSGVAPSAIAAIGITNQRETTIVWSRATGEPIGNAIVWQGPAHRSRLRSAQAARPRATLSRQDRPRPRCLFLGHQTRLAARSHARARVLRPTAASSPSAPSIPWLVWMLTGGADAASRKNAVHATDASNASRTLLFDIHEGGWSDELLHTLEIPRSLLGAGASVEPRIRAHACRSAGRIDSDRRRRRRSAERPVRAGLASTPARSRTPTAPAASC